MIIIMHNNIVFYYTRFINRTFKKSTAIRILNTMISREENRIIYNSSHVLYYIIHKIVETILHV